MNTPTKWLLAAMMALSVDAFAVSSRRSMFVDEASAPPPYDLTIAATGAFTGAYFYQYINATSAQPLDLQIQSRFSLTDVEDYAWTEATSMGTADKGRFSGHVWGWVSNRLFSDTSPAAFNTTFSVTTSRRYNDIRSVMRYVGSVKAESRYRVRYVDAGGDTVITDYIYLPPITDARVVDADPPNLLVSGSVTAIDFDFGGDRVYFQINDFECDDQPQTDFVGKLFRVTNNLTQEHHYYSTWPVVGIGGVGVPYTGYVAMLIDETTAGLVLSGEVYWDVHVQLSDAQGNTTGWILVDTVDMNNPLG